jgi:hypothetical protein
MSKKRTRKKAGGKKVAVRKGSKRPFKSKGGKRGIARSSALSRKAKRERAATNAKASATALALADKKAAKSGLDKTLKASDSGGTVVTPPKFPSKAKWARKGKKKRTGKKAGRRASKKVSKKTTAAAAAATKKVGKKRSKVMNRRRYKQGRAATPKFKLMHKFGLPRRGKVAPAKKAQLRKAAGYDKITFKQVMDTIRSEKLKGWVCVGPRRTGCGGGSKNLRGGHQIGIYATGHR